MEIYSRSQVAQLLGVDPQKIEGWVARGVLKPHGTGHGTGNPYRFSFAEIVRASIIRNAQEDLGSRFIRPGLLSRLLHDQLSGRKIGEERQRLEKTISKERQKGKGYIPTIKPHDLLLHIYRDHVQKEDGTWEGVDWQIKVMPRESENFMPRSFVHLRIALALIIRSILVRMDRMEIKAQKG